MNHDHIVRHGYNQAAHLYAAERSMLHSGPYVQQFLQELRQPSLILDVGCGDGTPTHETLFRRGHGVIGVDISETQIQRARQHFPRGQYIVGDMAQFQPGQFAVDGLLALYALFHIPRELHGWMLGVLNTYLPLNAPILITMGDQDFEGIHDFYGQQMWSSHYGPKKNSEIFKQAGFEVILDQMDSSGKERHQILLGRKVQEAKTR